MDESSGVSMRLYGHKLGSLILDRAAKQMECQAAAKKSKVISAHRTAADNQNLHIRKLKETMITALNNTSSNACNSLKQSQFVG